MSSKKSPRRTEAGHSADAAVSGSVELSRLTDDDLHYFNEGTHARLYERLGAHPIEADGRPGVHFGVWAPNAAAVSVVGAFNDWAPRRHPLFARGGSGIWEGFVPGLAEGALYKFHVESRHDGYVVDKADPFGFRHEVSPRTASVVQRLEHEWTDGDWMAARGGRTSLDRPMSIYEVHAGSWQRVPEEGDRPLTYVELGEQLAAYANEMGFTHVELMPVMEHPFGGSWGYQITGYFAPTSRFGSPQDFMRLVDTLHRHGVGVILDWVPSHFPSDEHGLGYFDGTHLFEHADPRQGFHPDWRSLIFNYGRHEVRSFLLSNALFWFDRYHVDGLRVDAVASMLYLDYSREQGDWIPNRYGGRESLEAIEFLRRLNTDVYARFPDVHMIAEESTAWPMVSRPAHVGGLGFGLKWDMGWMHDTLAHLRRDPIHRRHHHNEITFRAIYQFSENYVLPLSHDEVVHGKGTLLGKMPGDEWQKFANLRLLLASQWLQPGKKLLFMGGELGQWAEWDYERSLDWHLLETPRHRGVQRLVRELNRLYRELPALHELDCEPEGFRWLNPNDAERGVVSFLRCGSSTERPLLAVLNFVPVKYDRYQIGVPLAGAWNELLNTDAEPFGGSGAGNLGRVESVDASLHDEPCRIDLTIPPLAALLLEPA